MSKKRPLQIPDPELPEAVKAWAQQKRAIVSREPMALPPEPGASAPPPPRLETNEPTAYAAVQASRLLQEKAKRRIEALNLYVPLPHIQEFHACLAPERIIRGSNRAGKTLGAAVEVARAVTRQDPFNKYPDEGIAYCVGKDLRHCGNVMYRTLFRAGAFKIILDQGTGLWRAFLPWSEQDRGREGQAKPAPPLIPKRFVKSISWENKAAGIPHLVVLHTGWEIPFFSSEGKPPQGTSIDLAWFDEEIKDGDWYPELAARLVDRRGRFIWSATPQAGSEQLYNLHERAEIESEAKSAPSVVETVALLDDNAHLDDAQKRGLYDKLQSEEERRVRIGGEFAIVSTKVYPEYSTITHGCEPFEVPFDWTTYMTVDPGRQVCAVLFGACPPPDVEQEHAGVSAFLFQELYLRDCDAAKFGREVKRVVGDRPIQAFLVDHHGSRVTDAGSGRTVEQQYSEALRENGVRSIRSGYQFIWGSDDVQAGILAVKSWLRIQENGKPRLKVFRSLKNFHDEIKRYRNARDRHGEITDKPLQRHNHLMDCLRYFVMFNPKYVRRRADQHTNYAVKAIQAKRERQRLKGGRAGIHLGPGMK